MKMKGSADVSIHKMPNHLVRARTKAEVMMISGCKGDQALEGKECAGAVTKVFAEIVSLRPRVSHYNVLRQLSIRLKKEGYTQVPQLCAEHVPRLDAPFIMTSAAETAKRNISGTVAWGGPASPSQHSPSSAR